MSYGFSFVTGSGANKVTFNSSSYVPGVFIGTPTFTGVQNATQTQNYTNIFGNLYLYPIWSSTSTNPNATPTISVSQNLSTGTATITVVWPNLSLVAGIPITILVFMA